MNMTTLTPADVDYSKDRTYKSLLNNETPSVNIENLEGLNVKLQEQRLINSRGITLTSLDGKCFILVDGSSRQLRKFKAGCRNTENIELEADE
jgi:hypothetical protein